MIPFARSGVELNMVSSLLLNSRSHTKFQTGPTSPQYQNLSNATKGPICSVMIGTIPPSIEAIQALLVDACYSEKGWLLTSLALKMSLEIGLSDAYSQLCAKILESDDSRRQDAEECAELFRKARVWFGVFVLEHMCVPSFE